MTSGSDQFLPSCVVTRNEYSVMTYQWPCKRTSCQFENFTILSSDLSYVVFEDRVQSTPTQFVSQLGAEIGLYMGLSVLSIWQLLVFVYRRYKRFDDGRQMGRGFNHCKAFLIDLLKSIVGRFDESDLGWDWKFGGGCCGTGRAKDAGSTTGSEGVPSMHYRYCGGAPSMEKTMIQMFNDQTEEKFSKMEHRVDRVESKLDEIIRLIRSSTETSEKSYVDV